MLVGEALALGQFGLGLIQSAFGDSAKEQAVYNEAYRTTYQNSINQYRAEQQTKLTADAFSAKLDFVKNQIENNYLGAEASWVAEQMRLNEVRERGAYQSQALQKMLVESMGSSAASEVYGKSAKRGALVSTLGAYGRTKRQQVDQLMSETTQAQIRMQRTQQQMQAANKLAISQVSVLPQAQTFIPQELPGISTTSGLNTALQIGQLGMQAFQTGWGMTPTDTTFFGIPKRT